ncbi:signal peptidase I [Streptomyces sp. TLI_171]|uniref:signal peptidase I n=1 Tax=Streptomyces sp. TLI_171 TaxID=1938859 RepID=UPI000C5D8E84|nr:signal peptidase I [Streptomyces sp. TLI_171]RKE22380.1 signal peptidase I [Streptomyces sp. TLI_171]
MGMVGETGAPAVGEAEPARSRWRTVGVVLAVLLTVALVAAVAVAALAVRVDGHSMQPTLADGQRLLTGPGSGGRAQRFDVVLLRTPGRQTTMVKRVIGLPGDRVEILARPDGSAPAVLVQPGGAGQWYRVDVPAWSGQDRRATPCCAADGRKQSVGAAQLVPPGKLFVLGDNPDGSDDSRSYGWGELSAVSGRVLWRVWPPSVLGPLDGAGALVPVTPPEGS